jgi:predicted NBD/HSP70 family sugar kinase
MEEQSLHMNRRANRRAAERLESERLILTLVRRNRTVTKAELVPMTGLSLQSVNLLVNRLERDGLLAAGEKRLGRPGHAPVPYAIDGTGAYGLGLMVGVRGAAVTLIDAIAGSRAQITTAYAWPTPDALVAFAKDAIPEVLGQLPPHHRGRVEGLGVALPAGLWQRERELKVPRGALACWYRLDIGAALATVAHRRVRVCHDATAACAAELAFGRNTEHRDFLYVDVGALAGGGVVLDRTLYPGGRGNAGALGAMPVLGRPCFAKASQGKASQGRGLRQLVHAASLYRLERRLAAAGSGAEAAIGDRSDDWSRLGAPLDAWIAEAASGLAQAIAAALAVIDFAAVIVDGAMPPGVRRRLVARTIERLGRINCSGLIRPEIVEGTIGRDARAIGAAALPLLEAYGCDVDVLFREDAA